MALRNRLADWLTRDMYSHMIKEAGNLIIENQELEQRIQSMTQAAALDDIKARTALRAVIERGNTKSPNSTVRDMVRIAQEGLER